MTVEKDTLEPWIRHLTSCVSLGSFPRLKCDCGLDDALAALEAKSSAASKLLAEFEKRDDYQRAVKTFPPLKAWMRVALAAMPEAQPAQTEQPSTCSIEDAFKAGKEVGEIAGKVAVDALANVRYEKEKLELAYKQLLATTKLDSAPPLLVEVTEAEKATAVTEMANAIRTRQWNTLSNPMEGNHARYVAETEKDAKSALNALLKRFSLSKKVAANV